MQRNTAFVARASDSMIVFDRSGSESDWTIDTVFSGRFDVEVRDAGALLVLDSMSFPWEALAELVDSTVVYLVLPDRLSASETFKVFSKIVERLTFFDRLYYKHGDQAPLATDLSLHQGQWVRVSTDQEASSHALEDYSRRNSERRIDSAEPVEGPTDYWLSRGRALAARSPEHAVCSIRHSLAENKIMHVKQVRALRDVLTSIRPNRDSWRVVEFGCGVGRILSELGKLKAELFGIELSGELLDLCRMNLPLATCQQGDVTEAEVTDLGSMDLAIFVTVLHHLSADGKCTALRNALQTLRVGGRLVLLEDFVASTTVENPITMPVPIRDFFELAASVSCGSLVLEDARTLTYQHVLGTRTAILVMRKIS